MAKANRFEHLSHLPRVLAAAALALAFDAAAPVSAQDIWWQKHDGCMVYEHRELTGKSMVVDANYTYAYVGGSWNDRISGLTCEISCWLTVWEHRDYGGASRVFTEHDRWVGHDWNDRISSMEASCEPY